MTGRHSARDSVRSAPDASSARSFQLLGETIRSSAAPRVVHRTDHPIFQPPSPASSAVFGARIARNRTRTGTGTGTGTGTLRLTP